MWNIDKLEKKPTYLFEDALLQYLKSAEGQKDVVTKKTPCNLLA